jgi:hypothetical protein
MKVTVRSFFKNVSPRNIQTVLIGLFLFLLPWQTRWIFGSAFLNGNFWEYGTKSIYATELIIWMVGVTKMGEWIFLKKRLLAPSRFQLMGGGMMSVLVGISVFFSTNPMLSMFTVFHVLEGVALSFFIAHHALSRRKMFFALWAGGVLQAIIAIIQFFSQEVVENKWFGMAHHIGSDLGAAVIETSSGRWLRAYGAFGWPNSLGIYVAVIWIIGLVLYSGSVSFRQRLLLVAGQILIMSGLVVSFSRAASLAAVAGLLIFVFLKKRENHLFSCSQIFNHLIYAGLVVLFFFYTFSPLFETRLVSTERLEQKSVNERVEQYAQSYAIIKEHIWFGVGPGAYTWYLFRLHPNRMVWELLPVHNIYMLVLSEYGVFIFTGCVVGLWFFLRKHIATELAPLAVVLVGGMFDHWSVSLWGGYILLCSLIGLALKNSHTNTAIFESKSKDLPKNLLTP